MELMPNGVKQMLVQTRNFLYLINERLRSRNSFLYSFFSIKILEHGM